MLQIPPSVYKCKRKIYQKPSKKSTYSSCQKPQNIVQYMIAIETFDQKQRRKAYEIEWNLSTFSHLDLHLGVLHSLRHGSNHCEHPDRRESDSRPRGSALG